ncbi:helix-turn-helix domain-containing protein [Acidocella sp.]|uniref:helix-turn-helix domain-containing protein n=1 Tax=Acidocella sp. TaxID=50710 RepID=UPI003D010387
MEQTIYTGLAAKLREHRSKQGISQHELAGRAGLTRSTVASIEAGRQGVLLHHIYALASALDTTAVNLLPDAPEPPANRLEAPRKVELFVASLSARSSKAKRA